MRPFEKLWAKIESYCDKIDDKITDEDTMRVSKGIKKILLALDRLADKVPSIGPYKYIIKLAVILCTALENDGDLTKEDLALLVANYKDIFAAVKQLKS